MEKLKSLYFKYREILHYLFFGGCTTLVSWATYALFVGLCGLSPVLGNALSWICSVLFAFVTNKLWVFFSKSWKPRVVWKEAAEFFGSRAFTGVLELVGLPLLIRVGLDRTLFGIEGFVAKIVVSIVVIVLNYVLSKLFVFRKK